MKKNNSVKILLLDVETAPILAHVWGLWDQNIPLNMIETDWHLLSWSAKWHGQKKIMYMDQRNQKDVTNDKKLCEGIWKLMDEADVIVTQNGISFDIKKLNARFILHGMKPPSSFKNIDTKRLASKKFAFTSNKLEYLTNKLCVKYKKLVGKRKFAGFSLWLGCLANNAAAWAEMKKYNIYDVLSLEELYNKLAPWDASINFNVYSDDIEHVCSCGSTKFHKIGFGYTGSGKFQRFRCNSCGKESRSKINLLSPEKRKSLRR